MANNRQLASAAALAAANAVVDQLDNGYFRIYSGTQPANADTAVGAQVLLAELRFNATAFGAASLVTSPIRAAEAVANAFTGDASANATGTATWFRALASNGTTAVFDGSVGTSDADFIMNSTAIQAAAAVDATGFTYRQPVAV